jgi:hypothetical protein
MGVELLPGLQRACPDSGEVVMAVINVSCPQCATGYKIDEVHRGKKAKCKEIE